ncbi:MAG: rod-binding protein [Terriglobales bacterium]
MGDLRIGNAGSSNLIQAQSDLAVQALHNKSTKGASSKIDKAAHDFESLLVGQWLEKAEKSFATVPGTDPDQQKDSAHDQFQSIACESLAKSLSKAGGFGIATMISESLAAVETNRASAAKPEGTVESPAGLTMGVSNSQIRK